MKAFVIGLFFLALFLSGCVSEPSGTLSAPVAPEVFTASLQVVSDCNVPLVVSYDNWNYPALYPAKVYGSSVEYRYPEFYGSFRRSADGRLTFASIKPFAWDNKIDFGMPFQLRVSLPDFNGLPFYLDNFWLSRAWEVVDGEKTVLKFSCKDVFVDAIVKRDDCLKYMFYRYEQLCWTCNEACYESELIQKGKVDYQSSKCCGDTWVSPTFHYSFDKEKDGLDLVALKEKFPYFFFERNSVSSWIRYPVSANPWDFFVCNDYNTTIEDGCLHDYPKTGSGGY